MKAPATGLITSGPTTAAGAVYCIKYRLANGSTWTLANWSIVSLHFLVDPLESAVMFFSVSQISLVAARRANMK